MSNNQKRGTNDPPSTTSNTSTTPESQRPSQSQPEQSAPAPAPPSSSSLASRIQSSASGLARNAFYSTNPSAETAHLLSPGDTKATSGPGSSSSALAAAQQYKQETSTPGPSSHDGLAPHTGETFRSAQQHTGGFTLPPLSEDEFQHSHVDAFADDAHSTLAAHKGKGKAADPYISSRTSQSQYPPPQASYQESATDGAAVLNLLNSPAFDPEFPSTANEPFEPVETDLMTSQLTPSEIEMIESFRRQLGSPERESQSQARQLTSFSLVPDIDSVLNSAPAMHASDATALRDVVVSNLPGAADWVAVEERYHDEVWGYLRPTLEAARKEIEEEKSQDIRGTEAQEDGPAVRRLKMILKHMQA